jgi:predicted Zn-dependent protease
MRWLRSALAVFLIPALMVMPVTAQEAGRETTRPAIVRDAEIEGLMRDYAAPIFRAAGIPARSARIILVNNRSFNAFVANGQRIFLNTGALMDAETPNEVIGVIAHESGHIAGGHLARLRQQVATAQVLSVIGMLAGVGAAVGAAQSRSSVGSTGAGTIGVVMAGPELARRGLLAYQRSEEQAADQAAIRYLATTGQSPQGMLTTFRRFADSGLFRSGGLDPYVLSHPLPLERVAQLESLAAKSPWRAKKDPPALQARHDLMRAKLFGFTERPETVLRRYNTQSAPSRYARAILFYRTGRLNEALSLIDGLIRENPSSPWFHELRGQALLESGRPREAVPSLRKALALSGNHALIHILLAQALIAIGEKPGIQEATRLLLQAAQAEPDSPEASQHLAMAYGKMGDTARAELASAQSFFHAGDFIAARTQARRAMDKLPKDSALWLKAQDIAEHVPDKTP